MVSVDKGRVLEALRARLAQTLARLLEAQRSAQAGATHPDNRQEHAKDMRATEVSYLARGLAERVETLRDDLRAVELLATRGFASGETAAAGALVAVDSDDDEEILYFLAPAGGGEVLEVDGVRVFVLTPRSPVGAALAGLRKGDPIDVQLPSGRLRGEISSVD